MLGRLALNGGKSPPCKLDQAGKFFQKCKKCHIGFRSKFACWTFFFIKILIKIGNLADKLLSLAYNSLCSNVLNCMQTAVVCSYYYEPSFFSSRIDIMAARSWVTKCTYLPWTFQDLALLVMVESRKMHLFTPAYGMICCSPSKPCRPFPKCFDSLTAHFVVWQLCSLQQLFTKAMKDYLSQILLI